jgi:hypothetical protein
MADDLATHIPFMLGFNGKSRYGFNQASGRTGVLLEQRNLVEVAYPDFALASLALEPAHRAKPGAAPDQRVAAERAFERQIHIMQAL